MRLFILLILLATISGTIFSQSLTNDPLSISGCEGVQDTFYLEVQAGWNLISIPIIPDSNVSKIFSPRTDIFSFDSEYRLTDTMKPGVGYWVKFSHSETLAIVGKPVSSVCCTVKVGWNIIGTPCPAVSVSDIQQSTPGMLEWPFGDFFHYNYDGLGGYISGITTLMPWYGYFVKVKQAGTLLLVGDIYPPVLFWPENNSYTAEAPLLEWNTWSCNKCVHLQIAADSLFQTLLVDTFLRDTKYQSQFNTTDNIYYWRVGVTMAGGQTMWSEVRSFGRIAGGKN